MKILSTKVYMVQFYSTDGNYTNIEAFSSTEIENAINFAESSNFPEESELYDNVLA